MQNFPFSFHIFKETVKQVHFMLEGLEFKTIYGHETTVSTLSSIIPHYNKIKILSNHFLLCLP